MEKYNPCTCKGTPLAYHPLGDSCCEVCAGEDFSERVFRCPSVLDGREVIGVASMGFAHLASLREVILPEKLDYLRDSAFQGCVNLEHVILPTNLLEICPLAFMGCSKLTTIIFPQTLRSVGLRAFEGCESLKILAFPKGLRCIGDDAFKGCVALERVMLPADAEVAVGAFERTTKIITFPFRATG